jgi:RNA polymerase sigma-70 factor (ECF subfamily)
VTDRSEAFERLYAEHAPAIFAYALRRIERDAAQDVVSETFVVAWRRFGDWPSQPLPWLYGVARKVLANQRRSLRRQARVADRLAEQSSFSSPPVPDGALLAALGALGERDRELLMLVAWEGLSPQEAAIAIGCSANACRIRLHRARRKLERTLGSEMRSIKHVKPREAR